MLSLICLERRPSVLAPGEHSTPLSRRNPLPRQQPPLGSPPARQPRQLSPDINSQSPDAQVQRRRLCCSCQTPGEPATPRPFREKPLRGVAGVGWGRPESFPTPSRKGWPGPPTLLHCVGLYFGGLDTQRSPAPPGAEASLEPAVPRDPWEAPEMLPATGQAPGWSPCDSPGSPRRTGLGPSPSSSFQRCFLKGFTTWPERPFSSCVFHNCNWPPFLRSLGFFPHLRS